MKILITGGSSLLGKYLVKSSPEDCELALTRNKNIHAITSDNAWYDLDVRDRVSVFDVFEIVRPDVVIHCAAIGGVDYAENHYQQVLEVNAAGTQNVIDACNGYKAKIVYVSTNAVFSGNEPPYDENSVLEPVNAYGVIKRQAERITRDTANKWLIIRPFLMYGWPWIGGRQNWVTSIVQILSENRGSFKLVNDHIWQPTYALEVAETVWKLLFQNEEIYNVSAPERATLYEFGLKVCEVFGLEKNLIRPVKSKFFITAAKRPTDTSYDLIKLSSLGIMLSDIKTGLEKMKGEMQDKC